MSKTKSLVPRNEKGQFLKGQSGNPTGKAARLIPLPDGRLVSRTELFQMHLGDAVNCLASVIHNPDSKDRDKIVAAKILVEHAVGTPKQHVEINNTEENNATTINLKGETTEALRELVLRLSATNSVVDADYSEDTDGE